MNGVGISDTPENAELRDRYRTDDEMKSVQNGTGRRFAGRCWLSAPTHLPRMPSC
jgi:hypothetical protein